MRIDVFTIFPEIIAQYCGHSLLGKAIDDKVMDLWVHNIRDFGLGKHASVDDEPYGGGAGMVMRCEPIFQAVNSVKEMNRPLYVLSPGGRKFDQKLAKELSLGEGFSLICGRYEGFDERIVRHLADGELSVGDFVLAGGELAALVAIESVARLLPGFMGNDDSVIEESFSQGLIEFPQYTRPAIFEDFAVPEVLIGGDHEKIRRYRLAASVLKTLNNRPDMIEARGGLTDEEKALIDEFLDQLQ